MAANDEDKVKIELELSKDEVNVDPEPHISERAEKVKRAEEKVKERAKEVQDKEEELKEKAEKLQKATKKSKENESDKDSASTIGGYEPAEVAKAPLESPEPKDKKPPNNSQKTIMILGFAIIVISVFLWPLFNFAIFLGAAIVGAVVIAFGALVRV